MKSRATAAPMVLLWMLCWTAHPVHAQNGGVAPPAPTTESIASSTTGDRQAGDDAPSFGSLFTDLPRDIRHLPTRANAIWLGGAGALALAVHTDDATLTRKAVASERLDTLVEGGSFVGGGTVQAVAAVGTYAIGRLTNHPRVAILGADLVRGQIINGVLTQGIKLAVDRPRPNGARFSFPSGHSSATFATATVLERHFGPKAGIPAYVMATYVAASRLHDNKHYPSDVIFGAGIGIVSGRAVTVRRGGRTFALGPLVTPRGVGLALTRIETP
jgi:membrane-associated phospholipid phosphatase